MAAVAAWEREEARRTYDARCAVAAARELAKQTGPPREQGVPLPTVEQSSAMDLVTMRRRGRRTVAARPGGGGRLAA
ncbi:hypothetical protein ACFQ2B_00420 [Streptomyces stramineus]